MLKQLDRAIIILFDPLVYVRVTELSSLLSPRSLYHHIATSVYVQMPQFALTTLYYRITLPAVALRAFNSTHCLRL
jgi:hypothetical protein